ncbi:MAG: peptide chain release factor 1 [Thermoprotei archaeon]|nr:MAG: peptide chain release factor 1 [Thermoprotei archaeon]RLF17465.1 MAG: peptide chain release factor 1 [Thermoprotei archaeon]
MSISQRKRSSLEQYRLEKMIKELKSKQGRGTELISLYIPAGRPISDVVSTLRQEYSTAQNIKDRTTRHHVLDALVSAMQRLKLFRETPPNGLVIFSGYIPHGPPGSEKMEVYVLEPPEPINVYLYRCDSRFYVEFLEEMITEKDTFGLIVIDRSEAVFATLRGRRLEVLEHITSGVPGKHSAGGQSARRFERVIEQLAHEFYKRAGEYAKEVFSSLPDLKGILVGGPGPTKYDFLDGGYLPSDLKNKIVAVFDLGYTGEEGVYELVEKGRSALQDIRYVHEKEVVQDFLYHLARKPNFVAYGFEEVKRRLIEGAVRTLLVSEGLDAVYVKATCPSCSWAEEKVVKRDKLDDHKEAKSKCPVCGQATSMEEKPALDYYIELAEASRTQVEVVSLATEEGKGLKESFGGVAAILRYAKD